MFARKVFAVLMAFIILLSACRPQASAPTPTPSVPLTASLTELQGNVGIKAASAVDFAPAQAGMTLDTNGAVRTESDGRARLDLSSGTIVRVAPSSVFTLVSNDKQPDNSLVTKIKLELGQIFIVLNGGSMDVETPSGQASVRGSYLMVFIDPDTLDVYLTCLEGDCGAGNEGGDIKFVTGQAVRLIHGKPGDKPIPPIFNLMSDADIQEWLDQVPESKNILQSVFATLTAYPTAKPTATRTPTATQTEIPSPTFTPTATPQLCSALLTPENGATLKIAGKELFTWTEFPGAVKYKVVIVDPKGTKNSFTKTEPAMTIYIENLPLGGDYSWTVLPLDVDNKPLCESDAFAFNKPASPTATPVPTSIVSNDKPTIFDKGTASVYMCYVSFSVIPSDLDGLGSVEAVFTVKTASGNVSGSASMGPDGATWYGGATFVALSTPNDTISYYFKSVDLLGNVVAGGGGSIPADYCR